MPELWKSQAELELICHYVVRLLPNDENTMKTSTLQSRWVIPLVVLLLAGYGHTQEKPKANDPPKRMTVMQRKLIHAQKTLEGLALKDFDKITTGAKELTDCAREASWRILQTPKYETFSNDFIRSLENMKQAAKKKNIDAAALAYVEMTLTCVKCHQYVREEKMGLAPELQPTWPRTLVQR